MLFRSRYVADAREVVKAGDIVRVKVLEVDVARRRIGLTMRLDASPAVDGGMRPRVQAGAARAGRPRQEAPAPTAMASAFAKWQAQRR